MKDKFYKAEENMKSAMENYTASIDSKAFEQFSKGLDNESSDKPLFFRGLFNRFSKMSLLGLLFIGAIVVYGIDSFTSNEIQEAAPGHLYGDNTSKQELNEGLVSNHTAELNASTEQEVSEKWSEVTTTDLILKKVLDTKTSVSKRQGELGENSQEYNAASPINNRTQDYRTNTITEEFTTDSDENIKINKHQSTNNVVFSDNKIMDHSKVELAGSIRSNSINKYTALSIDNEERSSLDFPVSIGQAKYGLINVIKNTYKVGPIKVDPLEETIERPNHQLNFAIGGGMTDIEIDEPHTGNVTPFALANREAFLSVSYLYRVHRKVGLEIGARGTFQTQRIAHYFQAGDFDLVNPEYAQIDLGAYEGKYEFFANAHFYLPLDQRSELDFHIGYFALNPLSQPGGWGGGKGRPLYGAEDLTLIRSFMYGDSGPFEGGRLKLGVNYNFLTTRKNTVSFGISYMHELIKDVEGNYEMLTSNDFTTIAGNLRVNGSGFKVQFNYGFGLNFQPRKNKLRHRHISQKSPWYLGVRYGTKRYIFSDDLSKALVNANSQKYGQLYIGHYIKPRLAFETGLEFFLFEFSTPTEVVFEPASFRFKHQYALSVPIALRYDIFKRNKITLYGKGALAVDFRMAQQSKSLFDRTNLGFIVDSDELLLNAALETGVDFKLFNGVHLGLQGKYNHAFNRFASYEYPVVTNELDFEFEGINLKNQYFSWGIELKYMFNQ